MSNETDNVSTTVEETTVTTETPIENVTPVEATTPVETSFVDNSTKKNNLPVLIGAIVAIIVIGLGGFYYYTGSTKTIVTNLVAKVFDSAKDAIDTDSKFDIQKDSLSISGDAKITAIPKSLKEFEDLKDEKIGFNLGLDYKNKKFEAGASLTEGKKAILDVMAYVIDDEMFIDLKDSYDDIIKIDDDEIDFNDLFDLEDLEDVKFTNEDIQDLIEEFKDVVTKSIEMDKIEKSSDSITIDGKNVSVKKLTYKLNEKNSQHFVKNIIKNTLADKKLIKLLAKISDTDASDIKENLKDSLDDIEDIEALGTLNIYVKGLTNSFAGLEFIPEEEDGKLTITEGKDATEVIISADDTKVKFEVKELNNEVVDINFTVKADDQKVSGNVYVSCKETKKNNYTGKIKVNVNIAGEKAGLEMNYKMAIGSKIASINTKKAVNSSDLSSKDINDIESNLMDSLEKSKLYSIIEEYADIDDDDDDDYNYGYSNNYDYDYDFDDDYTFDWED